MIGIHNRSHYESRAGRAGEGDRAEGGLVRSATTTSTTFERMLADEGVTILKFFLHISKDEQKTPAGGAAERPAQELEVQPRRPRRSASTGTSTRQAYEDMLEKCSTEHAPWYVVPADRKWFRNWVLAETIVRTMEGLDMKYPDPVPGLDKIKIE